MPVLVKVLDGGPVSAGTIASVWALMEICMKNPAGQQELLQHEGLAKVRPHFAWHASCVFPGPPHTHLSSVSHQV